MHDESVQKTYFTVAISTEYQVKEGDNIKTKVKTGSVISEVTGDHLKSIISLVRQIDNDITDQLNIKDENFEITALLFDAAYKYQYVGFEKQLRNMCDISPNFKVVDVDLLKESNKRTNDNLSGEGGDSGTTEADDEVWLRMEREMFDGDNTTSLKKKKEDKTYNPRYVDNDMDEETVPMNRGNRPNVQQRQPMQQRPQRNHVPRFGDEEEEEEEMNIRQQQQQHQYRPRPSPPQMPPRQRQQPMQYYQEDDQDEQRYIPQPPHSNYRERQPQQRQSQYNPQQQHYNYQQEPPQRRQQQQQYHPRPQFNNYHQQQQQQQQRRQMPRYGDEDVNMEEEEEYVQPRRPQQQQQYRPRPPPPPQQSRNNNYNQSQRINQQPGPNSY